MRGDFERDILDNPDDATKYAVYADWLTDRGDPRGELIHVQLKLEDASLSPAERDKIRAREAELFAAHARDFLGALAGPLLDQGEGDSDWDFGCRHRFRWGFLDTIETSSLTVELVRGLLASPETRFLRRLILLDTEYIEEEVTLEGVELGEDTALVAFLAKAPLGNVRELQLGGLEPDNCGTNGEGVAEVIAGMPRLESLHLEAHGVANERIFALPLSRLTHLLVYHVHDYPVSVLADNPAMAHLETLRFHPHALEVDDEEAYLGIDDVRAIATSPHLRALRHLELRLCSAGDEGIELLLDHGLVGRLAVLDLRWGTVTDRGARLLAAHPDTAKLERLDLTGNQLTEAGITLLEQAGVALSADEQFAEGDPDNEYLWRGDME